MTEMINNVRIEDFFFSPIFGGKFELYKLSHVVISSHDSSANLSSKFKMASNGKWEVVGKGGKKRASNEGKKNKVKASDIPKAEIVSK